MRIVLVNWSPVSEGAARGGGVGGYCLALGEALAGAGHEVIHLSSGRAYARDPLPNRPDENPDRPGPCEIRRAADHGALRVYEITNSPVVAPAFAQFRDPHGELRAPRLDAQVQRFIGSVRPDVVHVHNIEGLTAGFVDAVRAGGADGAPAVLYSLHNYHTVCPQVNLLRSGLWPCADFDNGHLCDACIDAPDPREERLARVRSGAAGGRPAAQSLPQRLRIALAPAHGAAPVPPGAPFGTLEEHFTADRFAPMENDVPDPPANPRPLNVYGRRRRAMVRMLNSCDRVLAVSSFVERLFASMGVEARVLRRLTIGTRMAEQGRADPAAHAPARGARPISLCFLGFNLPFKGLPMLFDALELLTPEVRSRVRLSAHGPGVPDLGPRADALRAGTGGIDLAGPYPYERIPSIVAGADAGVVPSAWWDTGPQTVMEFLACGVPVLGARLGGIPDFVEHGVNGLLFRGNDRSDLARTIAAAVRDPALLPALRAGVAPPKSMTAHAAELEAQYRESLDARRHGAGDVARR